MKGLLSKRRVRTASKAFALAREHRLPGGVERAYLEDSGKTSLKAERHGDDIRVFWIAGDARGQRRTIHVRRVAEDVTRCERRHASKLDLRVSLILIGLRGKSPDPDTSDLLRVEIG